MCHYVRLVPVFDLGKWIGALVSPDAGDTMGSQVQREQKLGWESVVVEAWKRSSRHGRAGVRKDSQL